MNDNGNNSEPSLKGEAESFIHPKGMEPLDNIVCDVCFEKNLIEDVHIQECVVCGELYCTHHASVVDPTHCAECLHDVSVTVETIQKIETHEAKDGSGKIFSRTRKARQIKVGGLHWLFVQRKIPTLSDAELALAIEYHRGLYDSMIYEREKRRAETFHRNAGKQFKVPTSTTTTSSSTTTVKKSRTTKVMPPDKAAANLASMLEALQKQGLTQAQIMQMLKSIK